MAISDLPSRKVVVNGADWGAAALNDLLDASRLEPAFAHERFGGLQHTVAGGGQAAVNHLSHFI